MQRAWDPGWQDTPVLGCCRAEGEKVQRRALPSSLRAGVLASIKCEHLLLHRHLSHRPMAGESSSGQRPAKERARAAAKPEEGCIDSNGSALPPERCSDIPLASSLGFSHGTRP